MPDQFKIKAAENCGIGGWKCPCCGPIKTSDKSVARRRARRVLKQELKVDYNIERE